MKRKNCNNSPKINKFFKFLTFWYLGHVWQMQKSAFQIPYFKLFALPIRGPANRIWSKNYCKKFFRLQPSTVSTSEWYKDFFRIETLISNFFLLFIKDFFDMFFLRFRFPFYFEILFTYYCIFLIVCFSFSPFPHFLQIQFLLMAFSI